MVSVLVMFLRQHWSFETVVSVRGRGWDHSRSYRLLDALILIKGKVVQSGRCTANLIPSWFL